MLKKSLGSIKEIFKDLSYIDMAQFSSLLRGSIEDLEEIIGKTNSEDILNKIFKEFCVGK